MGYLIQIADNQLSYQTKSQLFDIEKKLTHIIQGLLNNNLDQLMSGLYRIDISEQTFRNIVSKAHSEQIGLLLAQEIIKREQYKDYFK